MVPELREAEHQFNDALDEACAIRPAEKADTGELIRADELLEAASDAAKRAISLRRRRRVDSAQRSARGALGEVEAAASPGAAHRLFADARGTQWDVFAVHPEARFSVHSQLKGTYPQGWLCFDSGTEKRRLSPIPEDWQHMTVEQLQQLCQRAEVAPGRRGRPRKDSGPEAGSA